MINERRGANAEQRNIDDDMPMAEGPGYLDSVVRNWQELHAEAVAEAQTLRGQNIKLEDERNELRDENKFYVRSVLILLALNFVQFFYLLWSHTL
jgi:hypothetical protein